VSVVQIYTDGGCSGNPGPGAWAYVILAGTERFEAASAVAATTNNRMELQAVISALQAVGRRQDWASAALEIYTDSSYVQKGITQWIRVWEANGWRTSTKQPVKNRELWQELRSLSARRRIAWRWLAGHAGHTHNEECDRLVRQAIAGLKA